MPGSQPVKPAISLRARFTASSHSPVRSLHCPDALLRRLLSRVGRAGKALRPQRLLHLLRNGIQADHPNAGLLFCGESDLQFKCCRSIVPFP